MQLSIDSTAPSSHVGRPGARPARLQQSAKSGLSTLPSDSAFHLTTSMRKIELPRISERIRGFTLPTNGLMYVFDYDEVFRVDLCRASVEVFTDNPYVFDEDHPESLGVSDNPPLLQTNRIAVTYSFDPGADSQSVQVLVDSQSHDISFRTLSGDWFVATLTPDERYLIIAEPYMLEVHAFETSTAASATDTVNS